MTLTAAPALTRGSTQALQPFYYTSSSFVEPLKEDISRLLSAFTSSYSRQSQSSKPFQLFKQIWNSEGWGLIHLRVLDARPREIFQQTATRLFVDRLSATEQPLARIGALFALYIFHTIQRDTDAVRIRALQCITLTIDSFEELMTLPDAVEPTLRPYAMCIISRLVSLEAFHVLPNSSLGPQNPRVLPHTSPILVRDIDYGHKKKTGRPSQFTQNKKAEDALSALETFVEKHERSDEAMSGTPTSLLSGQPTPSAYVGLKDRLRGAVSEEAVKTAEAQTMARIRDTESHVAEQQLPTGDLKGLERLHGAIERGDGLLGLVKSSNK